MKKTIKILLILIILVGLVTGGLYAGYHYKQGKKVVNVAPLSNIGTAEYWGDSIESYGQVTADKSQMGYLPKGSEVLSVNVKEGDHVEEGDAIITVKTESKDLNNKRLEITKATQNLMVEQTKLDRLMKTKPAPTYVYTTNTYKDYVYVSGKVYKAVNDIDDFHGDKYKADEKVAEENFDLHGNSTGFYVYSHQYDRGSDTPKVDDKGKTIYNSSAASKELIEEIKEMYEAGDFTIQEVTDSFEYLRSSNYFDYDTNRPLGETVYTIDGEIEYEKKAPTGMNAKELEEAIADEQDSIKKMDLELRKLQYEYETMENTSDDGSVYAKVSGTVSKLQDINNFNSNQPFFVVTATDEYFITGSIGEFYLNQLKEGDSVSISSWDTGNTADAVVTSISDTPAADGGSFWGGSGSNTNSSNYEFKASFDKNSGIDIGSAVDISITPEETEEKGIYVPSFLIRKDSGGSYMMKMNDEEKLEKVYVKVGKSVWGDYVQIKSGITIDDYVAFPYGDGAIEGINCKQVEYLEDDGGLG